MYLDIDTQGQEAIKYSDSLRHHQLNFDTPSIGRERGFFFQQSAERFSMCYRKDMLNQKAKLKQWVRSRHLDSLHFNGARPEMPINTSIDSRQHIPVTS